MSPHSFPHIRVKGSPYERGRQYGQQAAAYIRQNIEVYQGLFAHYIGWDWAQATEHALIYEAIIGDYRPHFLDEIRGIAKGAGVAYEDILALNVRTEIRNAGIAQSAPKECTAFVVLPPRTKDRHTLIGQNWDWVLPVTETIVILEVESDNSPNFVTVVEAGLLAKVGMNAAGIGLTTNALNSDLEKGEGGIPYHVILRAILESENFSEAIGAVISHPRASAANYLVAHQAGESFNAETAPGNFSRAYIDFPEADVYAHTNHYLSREIDFKDLGPWRGTDTLVRHQRMEKFLRTHPKTITVPDLQTALADHFNFPDAICCHPDFHKPKFEQFISIASVIMDLDTNMMWLAEGNPCETAYRKIAYGELLEG